MTNYHLHVANIKCGGCANAIRSSLDALEGVHHTFINITNGSVIVDGNQGLREKITSKLMDLGYPEADDLMHRSSFRTVARSFLSCIKGRLQEGKEYRPN